MMMRMKLGAWLGVRIMAAGLLVGAIFSAGCIRRTHLAEDHGVVSKAWFDAQQRATEDEVADGLDSEEATTIYAVYQRMLSGETRGRTRDDSPVLILQEPSRGRAR